MNNVYLNGAFLPLAEAKVSVLDRGFVFGDGVYEVIPVYARKPFRLQEHLRRLQHSLAAIRLNNPLSDAQWTALFDDLIARHTPDNQSLYLQITRGVADKRAHEFPSVVMPTVFAMSTPLTTPSPQQIAEGVACITAADFRWLRCDIKSIALLANCLLKQLAVDAGVAEVVLLRDGFLTEAAASNVFVVRNQTLLAPPKNHLILPGITYDVVCELARNAGIALETRAISEAEVRSADELWLSSSTKEVLAVTTLDGQPVGSGKPGPLFSRMHAQYQGFKQSLMQG